MTAVETFIEQLAGPQNTGSYRINPRVSPSNCFIPSMDEAIRAADCEGLRGLAELYDLPMFLVRLRKEYLTFANGRKAKR